MLHFYLYYKDILRIVSQEPITLIFREIHHSVTPTPIFLSPIAITTITIIITITIFGDGDDDSAAKGWRGLG